jgi:hypothetical protein
MPATDISGTTTFGVPLKFRCKHARFIPALHLQGNWAWHAQR